MEGVGDMQGVLPEGQEAHVCGVVRLLPGDFALCTTNIPRCPYALVPMRRVPADMHKALYHLHAKNTRCEIELPIEDTNDPNVLRGVFQVEALHTDVPSGSTLVVICGRDPRYGDSFAWYPTARLRRAPTMMVRAPDWEEGDEVLVCRWEWEYLHRITWHAAVITDVSESSGLYTVEYTPPLRFKCEEGGNVTHYKESGVTFTRIRC